MSQQYDNKGQVSFWKNENYSPSNKQPQWRGTFIVGEDFVAGDTVEISLWPNVSDNPRAPGLKGKGQRPNPKYAQKNNSAQAYVAQPVEDEIPF